MTPEAEGFLRRAIELAAAARQAGNPPFGSLLVGPDGTVLAEEQNTTITDGDISFHPELKLARWAARELDAEQAAGTTMYTSCQPCGMCAGALARSGLGRVVLRAVRRAARRTQAHRRLPRRTAGRAGAVRRGARAGRRATTP